MPKKTNNDRKFAGQKGPRPDLAKIKKTEAAERQAAYDKLPVDEKIAKLDLKLGTGLGAKKQRARFAALMEKKNTQVAAEPSDEGEVEKPKMKAKERHNKEKKS